MRRPCAARVQLATSITRESSQSQLRRRRYLPCGAELQAGATRFRLWAPDAHEVDLLAAAPGGAVGERRLVAHEGWHELTCEQLPPGSRYQYRIDRELVVPDPASRFNPLGVHGPSEVIDPLRFEWRDVDWRGRPWHEAVIYEVHVGTFTPEGTFAAMIPRLAQLAELGITALELLPIATFPGERGWGYDGVLPFAPHPAYGRPEDLKQLVQAAHSLNLMVLLDVVYNHFGPDGNFLPHYARGFFDSRQRTPWGEALDFESRAQFGARRFFIENALYWLEEYHLDGLRLDAVHAIHDSSDPHFIDELAHEIGRGPGNERHVHLVLENSANQASRLRVPAHTTVSRSQWNDDFHHPLHVLLSGERDGYYADYASRPLEQLGRVLTEGFAFQGELSTVAGNLPRGESSIELPPTAFVNFLQNHDQIGNRALGERLAKLIEPRCLRAALAILLLAPQPPMLFMGEEYAAVQPFCYFCDYQGGLARAITEGRRNEFASFQAFADPAARARIPDPNDPATFTVCKLAWQEREQAPHRQWLEYTRELLRVRASHVTPLINRLLKQRAVYLLSGASLSVDWPLENQSRLVLRANLSADPVEPVTAGAEAAATLLFHSAALDMGSKLGPWEVQLLLA
jgi:malto-oligosyltrehalose trehalohydrolase